MSQPQLLQQILTPSDAVDTPDWCAKDMVDWFLPTFGAILDPCKGDGVFLKYRPDAMWCEIKEGVDFFAWERQVGWIIGNPPYSRGIFKEWLMHSFEVARHIVYLIPLQKLFNAYGMMTAIREHGWIEHVRVYGTGNKLGFPMGNAMGAVHFMQDWWGGTSWSWYE